ncbi:GntR family transcriptional regulator [Psychrobacillus sp. FSL K6-2836]|uniref:GntR family transcriptional regulator n=1 Tax=Psychrobacillus sp. FSL K6-2836 TaxID=2921548 RepID=UPI0030F616AD
MLNFDNSNLSERVYLYIRNKILDNKLKPGSKINYEELCSEIGISRTPLRDALNLLKQDGLVEVKPRSGTYVCLPQLKDIEEIFDVRKALEIQALKSALTIPKSTLSCYMKATDYAGVELKTGNLQPFLETDRKLHQTIMQNSNNNLLISIMDSLETKIKWLGALTAQSIERPIQANNEHKKILTALYESNLEEAVLLMGIHIDGFKRFTIEDNKRLNNEIRRARNS